MAAEKVQLSLSSQKADDNRRVIAQELADARKNTGLPKLTKAANNAMLAAKAKCVCRRPSITLEAPLAAAHDARSTDALLLHWRVAACRMEGMMDGSGRELLPRVRRTHASMGGASTATLREVMACRMPLAAVALQVGASVQDKMQSARRGAALASALGTAGLEKQLAKVCVHPPQSARSSPFRRAQHAEHARAPPARAALYRRRWRRRSAWRGSSRWAGTRRSRLAGGLACPCRRSLCRARHKVGSNARQW